MEKITQEKIEETDMKGKINIHFSTSEKAAPLKLGPPPIRQGFIYPDSQRPPKMSAGKEPTQPPTGR